MALSGATHVTPDSQDKATLRRVFFTGNDAIYKGYCFCWDRDNITATNYAGTTLAAAYSSGARAHYVEKPAAGNLHNFAGVATKDYAAKTGGQYITIQVPEGTLTDVYTDQSCTINSTILTVQAASFAAGGIGEGPVIGRAVQTLDRSSTNGTVQAILVKPNELAGGEIATPSSTVDSISPAIWSSCPWEDINAGRLRGYTYWNDFREGIDALAANQTATYLGAGVYGYTSATAGSTLAKLATDPKGVLQLASTTDNEDVGIMIGGGKNTAGSFIFSTTTKLWMEARIRAGTITNDRNSLFCGFAEEALCSAAAICSDTDTVEDKDIVAFYRPYADGDGVDVIHNTAGGGGVTTAGDAVGALALNTWTNLGIYSDGTSVYFYQDGVLIDTVLLAATNFPDGEEMAFYFVMALGNGADQTTDIDWVRIAQLD